MGRLRQYYLLMRLDRPIGILLLLWPTLWALWVAAEGWPDPWILSVFVAGVVLMRSAGCVINDYADRKVDPYVERTSQRPLAAGNISTADALWLFSILSLVAFVLVLSLNRLTIALSFVGVLLAFIYPFMKRYTYLPQVFLGLAFGWAVPMAFAAVTNEVPVIAWLMLIATVLWATAYDTMYAMVDRADDIKIGVKSTAILFGDADRVIIGIIQLLMFWVLVVIGTDLELGLSYYGGLSCAMGLMVYQQFLIRDRSRVKCFKAFLNNNWVGFCIFAGLFWHYT